MKSLNILKENEPSEGLLIDENGKVTLPKGYLWCMNCEAATLHTKGTTSSSLICNICGQWKCIDYGCTNCGWEPEEELKPAEMYVIRHSENCPEVKKIREWEEGDFHMATDIVEPLIRKIRVPIEEIEYIVGKHKCDCPFDIIYPCLNVFNYSSWTPYSMDCMNAVEWSYDIRCPICGEVFSVSDGNC